MAHIAKGICVLSTTAFASAALYISVAEHPARMECDTRTALSEFRPSYKKAAVMQASLSMVSCLSGTVAWRLTGDRVWLVAGVVVGSIVPFTLAMIMPVNRLLLADECDPTSDETRNLLVKWGRLHAVRTVMSTGMTLLLYHHLFRA